MGTRGFIGFVVNGEEKIAYNHFDSYPEGLGVETLKWLRNANLAEVVEQARALRVAGDEKPTPEDVERLQEFTNLGVGESSTDDWYCLLRNTQGDPDAILRAGVIEDARGFPFDSLFCEWGYLVDLDRAVFECYKGFQKSPHDEGRWGQRATAVNPWAPEHLLWEQEYKPVRRVAEWSLERLPDDDTFLKALESKEGDQ
jgi:hypothetical protein